MVDKRLHCPPWGNTGTLFTPIHGYVTPIIRYLYGAFKKTDYFYNVGKSTLFLSMFFLAITLASSLKIAATLGYYILFTDDFIERYCENKERPKMHCDGKCYLSKMLLQKSNDRIPPINVGLLKNETVLFLEKSTTHELVDGLEPTITNYHYTNHYNYSFQEKHTPPPRS